MKYLTFHVVKDHLGEKGIKGMMMNGGDILLKSTCFIK